MGKGFGIAALILAILAIFVPLVGIDFITFDVHAIKKQTVLR